MPKKKGEKVRNTADDEDKKQYLHCLELIRKEKKKGKK